MEEQKEIETKELEIFLRVLTFPSARSILNHLDEHERGRYVDLMEYVNAVTLGQRLRALLEYQILERRPDTQEKRGEWYGVTNKGKEILRILKELEKLVEPDKVEEFLNLIGSRFTAQILEFMEQKEQTRYGDMTFLSCFSLNKRLHYFLKHGVVEHHVERLPLKREWYELTERGRKMNGLLRRMSVLLEKN